MDAFVAERRSQGEDRFDLRKLPPVMRAELAYGLQRELDELDAPPQPRRLAPLIKCLPGGVDSLREKSLPEWFALLGLARNAGASRRFLRDTLDRLEELDSGVGWETEFGRDVWLLRRLGYSRRYANLRFAGIGPEWLRDLAKRWARWRMATGQAISSVQHGVAGVVLLSEEFPELAGGPHALTRQLIERYLAHLTTLYPNPKTRNMHVGAIAGLLRATRQRGWEPRLSATADIYSGDFSRLDAPSPRGISEAVMAQLGAPANLDRFPDQADRVLAELLMGTGLRVGDACRIGIDCVVRDQHGAPYLRYRNSKMKREAVVPIDSALAATIAKQQDAVRAQFPDAPHLFVQPLRNPLGRRPYRGDTFRRHLGAWLGACEVRDELGRLVHITPHQWRHTYATRLINADVPQEVVRRLLDHSSHLMTARYAVLSQQTIRAKWEAARKVDIRGREIAAPDSALADAQWMKDNLARAKMALPNGYCGLPLQQSCEYANACLTCPMFVTTAEFLPEHRRQLKATRELIVRGETAGQTRLVEMNRTVERNLVAIIGAVEDADETPPQASEAVQPATDVEPSDAA